MVYRVCGCVGVCVCVGVSVCVCVWCVCVCVCVCLSVCERESVCVCVCVCVGVCLSDQWSPYPSITSVRVAVSSGAISTQPALGAGQTTPSVSMYRGAKYQRRKLGVCVWGGGVYFIVWCIPPYSAILHRYRL